MCIEVVSIHTCTDAGSDDWFAFGRSYSPSNCNITHPASWSRGLITPLSPPIKKNCSKLFIGDINEVLTVQKKIQQWNSSVSETQTMLELTNCTFVREEYSSLHYVSPVEERFPIAYILLVYTNPQQIIRFLKAVYRPHNVYCIHPDPKSGLEYALYFRLLSQCLDNVFVTSTLYSVSYGDGSSTFDAQMSCYQDLLNVTYAWRYVINLCGRDLPLRTNREIVEKLILLNGSSIIAPFEVNKQTLEGRFYSKLNHKQPHGIRLYKSSSYNALSRKFITFLLENQTSIDFYYWIRNARVPEEHFYASMYMYWLSEVYHGHTDVEGDGYGSIVSVRWVGVSEKEVCCAGEVIHHVCIISTADLHLVQRSTRNNLYMFYNKYFMEDDHVVMDCMEERLTRQNKLEYLKDCGRDFPFLSATRRQLLYEHT